MTKAQEVLDNLAEGKIKTIDKLPKSMLVYLAKQFGHRSPEKQGTSQLAEFISDSI